MRACRVRERPRPSVRALGGCGRHHHRASRAPRQPLLLMPPVMFADHTSRAACAPRHDRIYSQCVVYSQPRVRAHSARIYNIPTDVRAVFYAERPRGTETTQLKRPRGRETCERLMLRVRIANDQNVRFKCLVFFPIWMRCAKTYVLCLRWTASKTPMLINGGIIGKTISAWLENRILMFTGRHRIPNLCNICLIDQIIKYRFRKNHNFQYIILLNVVFCSIFFAYVISPYHTIGKKIPIW